MALATRSTRGALVESAAMRESVLPLLACPDCRGDLALAIDPKIEREADGHVMTGTLQCAGCAAGYPIVRGIPRLGPARSMAGAVETAARFGAEWKLFDHMATYQEQWLAAWLTPVGAHDFAGKTVFEGGCGKGRHSVVAAGWGVKQIVSLDLGDAIEVAFQHTRHLPNVHAIQGDLLEPPVRRGAFDLAFSVGVLHHLPAPRTGFDVLRGLVRPGGKLAIWVYGLESNEWITRWVTPVRERVTARMPPKLLYWLSLPPSAALAAVARLYASTPLGDVLPYRDYIRRLAPLPLREVHSIVFDQLVTPIAYYLPEDEVRRWFDVAGLSDVTIAWHNRNSWRGSGTVTG
jgi:SAM-dependent methyltransferase